MANELKNKGLLTKYQIARYIQGDSNAREGRKKYESRHVLYVALLRENEKNESRCFAAQVNGQNKKKK